MIRVKYSSLLRPPGPLVDVLLGHPDAPPPGYATPAQLDTGADRTVIPLAVAHALGLWLVGQLEFGVVGHVIELPVYYVTIRIDGVMYFSIDAAADAAADPDEPRVLLGRDVLNCLYATLSGPTRFLELSDQPLPTPATP